MTSEEPKPGLAIDERFLLEERLGAGTSGQIWKARDLRSGDPVAIKILHLQLKRSVEVLTRMRTEAEALSKLEHPGIARCLGFSVGEDRAYLVMELVSGLTLETLIGQHAIRGEPIDDGALADLFIQLCEALVYAHEHRVLHRDLKPQNVMVERSGSRWRLKVLDFGLAKLLDRSDEPGTTQGRRLGTLFYRSPEQSRGEPVDERSDVFALGTILFELFTMRRAWARDKSGAPLPAFDGSPVDARINAPTEVLARSAAEARPTPSLLRRNSRLQIDEIFTKATAPRAEERYPTVQALLAAFRSRIPAPGRPVRAWSGSIGIGAVAVLVVVGAVAGLSLLKRRPEAPPPPLPEPRAVQPLRAKPAPPKEPRASEPSAPDAGPESRSEDPRRSAPRTARSARRRRAAPASAELSRLERLFEAAASSPTETARLEALSRAIQEAAQGVEDRSKRERIKRIAMSSAMAGDLAGLEQALSELRSGIER